MMNKLLFLFVTDSCRILSSDFRDHLSVFFSRKIFRFDSSFFIMKKKITMKFSVDLIAIFFLFLEKYYFEFFLFGFFLLFSLFVCHHF